MTASEPPPRGRRAAFAFVFVTVLLDMLALGIIVPVLPNLVQSFVGGDTARAAGLVGWFGAVWALMQFVCSPLLGSLSDRFGRRPVLLISLTGLGLDYILMALAPNIAWLFIGRVISGITAATGPTASAYVADVTAPDRRAGVFGLLAAAWSLGFTVGPAVGGVLGHIDIRLPFWVAAGMTLLGVVYGVFVLPESLKPENRTPLHWKAANPVGAVRLLGSSPILAAMAGVLLLYFLAQTSLPTVFVLYAYHRYGWTEMNAGLSLGLIGVAGVIVQAGLVRPVVKRIGEAGALIAGLTFSVLGYMAWGLAGTGWVGLAVSPIFALGGFTNPGLQGLMSRHVGPDRQGRLQGASASIMGLTSMVGPVIFGSLFAASIRRRPEAPGQCFYLSATLTLIALILAIAAVRQARARRAPA